MSTEYADTQTVMGDLDEAIADPAKNAEFIGRIPSNIVSNFSTNKVRLDSESKGRLRAYGPRLEELAKGLPGTQPEFDRAVSEFRATVDTVLKRGSVGTGATGARRRRKTRKGKGKSRKTLRRRR